MPKNCHCSSKGHKQGLKDIYYTFVYPHLLNGIELYGNTKASYLDKLIKLNNKLLRILQSKPLEYST